MLKKYLLFISLLLLGFLPEQIYAVTLHAFVICDTSEYDIGYSTRRDSYRLKEETEKMAYYTGMELKYTELTGVHVQPRKMWKAISDAVIEEDDAVIFYFSGHGIHLTSEKGTRWPDLYFSMVDKTVPLADIYSEIVQKKPRFALFLADSCNNFLEEADAPPRASKKGVVSLKQVYDVRTEAYKKLFLESKGSIIAVGAIEGGYAFATSEGGCFTNTFFDRLNTMLHRGDALDWESLLITVRDKLIFEGTCTPDYSIHF